MQLDHYSVDRPGIRSLSYEHPGSDVTKMSAGCRQYIAPELARHGTAWLSNMHIGDPLTSLASQLRQLTSLLMRARGLGDDFPLDLSSKYASSGSSRSSSATHSWQFAVQLSDDEVRHHHPQK